VPEPSVVRLRCRSAASAPGAGASDGTSLLAYPFHVGAEDAAAVAAGAVAAPFASFPRFTASTAGAAAGKRFSSGVEATGSPCSLTIIVLDAGLATFPLMSSALDPIIKRKSAAIAVWGRIAHDPASEITCDTRRPIGTTFCASFAAARIRSSRSAGGSTTGITASRRVAFSPENNAAQRAHPATCRLAAALVTSSSSS